VLVGMGMIVAIMAVMIVAFVGGLAVQRGLSRFRVGVVFEGVGSAQLFCLPGANSAPTIRLYWLMPEADFWLQSISARMQAFGSLCKVKQHLAARAEPSGVQAREYLISW